MIYANIETVPTGKATDLMLNIHHKVNGLLGNEKGQALLEHSLIIGSISGSLTIVRDNPYLMVGIVIVLLILLLFWRPKVFATIIIISVLLAIGFFIYRWVEYGHI
jgi:hypothetical protein